MTLNDAIGVVAEMLGRSEAMLEDFLSDPDTTDDYAGLIDRLRQRSEAMRLVLDAAKLTVSPDYWLMKRQPEGEYTTTFAGTVVPTFRKS